MRFSVEPISSVCLNILRELLGSLRWHPSKGGLLDFYEETLRALRDSKIQWKTRGSPMGELRWACPNQFPEDNSYKQSCFKKA